MADIWCGNILLPDGKAVTDVILASQNIASSPALAAPTLRFLSTVDTARIPLYLATGPSLDVWTSSETTQDWFQSVLLSEAGNASDAHKWWRYARAQSPIGILVQVDSPEVNPAKPRVTEILFYGTIASPPNKGLPTPPSSSPDLLAHPESLPELQVHALPLSSDLLHQYTHSDIPPLSPSLDTPGLPAEVEPQFLPPRYALTPTTSSPKRKRDIFDEAEITRKKARGRGGESVAAAAARAHDSQRLPGHRKSLSVDTKAAPLSDIRPPSAHGTLSRPPSRQLSRSPSLSSDIRPLSRKGVPETQTKRSNLSQVATVPLQPEEPTVEVRNKEALSRVVMAAMRMHGLQQRKKTKSRRNSVAPGLEVTEELSEEAVKDEEYKMVYHQTYKGAALALRKHISTKPLHTQPDRLRNVVEKLLGIFCTDPLTEPLPTEEDSNALATPGSKQRLGIPGSTNSRTSPFDLPSAARATANKSAGQSQAHTGSPVSKRKVQQEQSESK